MCVTRLSNDTNNIACSLYTDQNRTIISSEPLIEDYELVAIDATYVFKLHRLKNFFSLQVNMPLYCGDKPILPPNYEGFDTRYNCLRKGVGVGKYLAASATGTATATTTRRLSTIPIYVYIIIGLLIIIIVLLLIFILI